MTLVAVTVVTALLVSLAAVPASAAGKCRVTNAKTGARVTSLERAVNRAKAGHTLVVRGTCRGDTTIRKSLVIVGKRSKRLGRPSIVGTRYSGPIDVSGGVGVTMRSLVIRRGPSYGSVITNRGRLRLDNVVVRGGAGGGIQNYGRVLLTGRTIVARNNDFSGGGVDNDGLLELRDRA